ncbi:MAG: glycosyltransferase family 39 protein, partial [Actinomycetota bacterium]|nr:glycosyltransferase family 39 protein [Actinomycetota bacterium]
ARVPWVALTAGAVTTTLVVLASRYGYHRDELYFLAAGRHLAWSYADQGPLTPLIARVMSEIAPGSLTVLRLPSAVAAGTTVLLTGLLAREFGAGRRGQALAAACAAVGVIVLFTGHLLSTSTFDLLCWTAVSWLVVRAVRTGDDWLWPVAGVLLGLGLLNKPLPAFLAAALLVGVLVSGPRRLLGDRFVWAGAAVTVALWSPWLIWQATHGWPQIDVSRSIAAGNSTSSTPWWQIVPFQALLVGPLVAPVWIAGLVRLLRDPDVRDVRFLAWAWALLALVFMGTGGKPYYLAGLLPALLGAGSKPTEAWLTGGRPRARRALLAAVLAVSAVVGAIIALPILPADSAGPTIAVNADVGETIGWPELARTVAAVKQRVAPRGRVVILTANYGEADAIDRYGPALGLPHAYSGQNAYGDWGPPPNGVAPVIAVGLDPGTLAANLRGCALAARIDNSPGVDNQERGQPVMACRGPRRPWSAQWPTLRYLG